MLQIQKFINPETHAVFLECGDLIWSPSAEMLHTPYFAVFFIGVLSCLKKKVSVLVDGSVVKSSQCLVGDIT